MNEYAEARRKISEEEAERKERAYENMLALASTTRRAEEERALASIEDKKMEKEAGEKSTKESLFELYIMQFKSNPRDYEEQTKQYVVTNGEDILYVSKNLKRVACTSLVTTASTFSNRGAARPPYRLVNTWPKKGVVAALKLLRKRQIKK